MFRIQKFGIQSSEFRVQKFELRAQDSGSRVEGWGFKVWVLGFICRVRDSGFPIADLRISIQSSGYEVQSSWLWDLRFRFRHQIFGSWLGYRGCFISNGMWGEGLWRWLGDTHALVSTLHHTSIPHKIHTYTAVCICLLLHKCRTNDRS